MNRILLALLLTTGCAGIALAQDIPMFSQKLTNSFIYNPALAGHTFGSMTASYRTNYVGVEDAPVNYYMSLHSPFANYRFGAGFNVFQEEVGVLKSTFTSAAYAYHLHFTRFSILSLGVGGELNTIRSNFNANELASLSGDLTAQPYLDKRTKADFSFGTMYQNRYIKIGMSANRLSTAWFQKDTTKLLANFYSGFAQGLIHVRGGDDLLEPYIAFRKFSESSYTYDVGLYYTYDSKITFGGATRKGKIINTTLAYRLSKFLLVGYSTELILGGSVNGFAGSSHEVTLRYDFNDQGFKTNFKSDYKSAVAYRKKTLSPTSAKKSSGNRSPKQLAKSQKKISAYSPNTRFQNNKKLSGGKKSMGKNKSKSKKSFSKKKPGKKSYKKRR